MAQLLRRPSRRWGGVAGGCVLLAAAGFGAWAQHSWPAQAQRDLEAALADSPYRLTLREVPQLRWGWSPAILLPDAVLTPRQDGPLPPVRLEAAALRLHWWGGVARFEAARAVAGLRTPMLLREIQIARLRRQDGIALTATLGPAGHPEPLTVQIGAPGPQGRALLIRAGALEAAGVWTATPTGGQLDLLRLRLNEGSGQGRLTVRAGRIGGMVQFDRLRLTGSRMPFRDLLTALRPRLDPVRLSAGQVSLAGLTLNTVQAELTAERWQLRAGQGPSALRAAGTWQADETGWGLPELTWQSRSLSANGRLTGAAAPETRLLLTADRLDLRAPGGQIDTMRLLDWLRSRSTPLRVRLVAATATLPVLPRGSLDLETTFADGVLTLVQGDWQATNGDSLSLGGTVNVATLFPKLDLTLAGERAARPDRLQIRLTGPATHPELDARLTLREIDTHVTGAFNFLIPTGLFKGTLDLHGPQGPLAQGRLRITEGLLVADPLTVSVDGNRLTGRAQLDPRGPLPQLTAELATDSLTLTQLGRLAGLGASSWATQHCPQIFATRLPPFRSTLALRAAVLPLRIGTVRQATLFIEGHPDGAQGRLSSPQGHIDLNLPVHSGQPPTAQLQFAVRGLPLAGSPLLRQGQADLSGTLVTPAPCAPEWAEQLRGTLSWRLREATLGSVDLDRLSGVLATQGLGGLLSPDTRAALGDDARTPLPDLQGQVMLTGGALRLPPVAWAATHYSADLSGDMNLSDERIDLKARIAQKLASGTVPVTLRIRGTLTQPDLQLR